MYTLSFTENVLLLKKSSDNTTVSLEWYARTKYKLFFISVCWENVILYFVCIPSYRSIWERKCILIYESNGSCVIAREMEMWKRVRENVWGKLFSGKFHGEVIQNVNALSLSLQVFSEFLWFCSIYLDGNEENYWEK